MQTLAILSSQAFSISNFRGPLIEALASQGVRIFALAPDFDKNTRAQVKALGAIPIDISMQRAGLNPLTDLLCLVRLFFLLRKLQPDVLLGYFIKPVIFGMTAAWLARIPYRVALIEGLGFVFTSNASAKRQVLKRIVSGMYKLSLFAANKVVFLNTDDIDEFLAAKLVNSRKIVNLKGIGVNLSTWHSVPTVIEPFTFLLVARLLREKGILEYVEAARLVKAKYPKVRFILLGALDVNPSSLTQKEVDSWVSEGLIEWPGHVAVQPWLTQTSVFVLPSYREGLPRSTQEAMAMARPVITTDVPGCRETVIDNVNGFLVPARDPAALAHAMFKFVEQPELVKPMGQQSRRLAEKYFDGQQKTQDLISILRLAPLN